MANSLFQVFDSSTNSLIDLNWLSIFTNLFIFPSLYWINESRLQFMFMFIFKSIFNEFKLILNNKFNFFNIIIFMTIFCMIFINNFMGLFPYIFTCSSHLVYPLTIALPLWISIMSFGWFKNYNFMFSHLVPPNTPLFLTPFMVVIETISNLIRPLTLTVRLCANMVAGHLLLTLLSQSCVSNYIFFIIIFIQMILLSLEFSVSFIQAYVFSALSTLYSNESN